ncbi:hypothetical protein BDB00DRAFT_870088 [Zychaea mexicana]|uniref:uncharacterized protein n=1 Tax=Zychaea mexicana TaxID=64656 RepID=UPI0022FE3B95|nr:uncharacterized protein BDB00DRAFT_870088 [Zychaea mexicana]KAI9495866.1 hypothetical protein BDB00DRAFT_870088 [Zychaea mexicana]
MGVKNDYRVSQIVVLCKDCGQDVGLYPARHKCEQVVRPPLPPINFDKKVKRNMSTTGVSRIAVDANQWKCVARSNSATTFDRRRKEQQHQTGSRREFIDISNRLPAEDEEDEQQGIKDQDGSSLYYDRFAANLPQKNPKRFWDKVRDGMMDHGHGNNQLPWTAPKGNNENSSSKLWNKLMDSVQHKLHDDDGDVGAESDASDWEGESHVSRVLREYYEKKRAPLPHYLTSREDDSGLRRHQNINNQYDSVALATGTVRKKPSLLEQRPSHRRYQKLWEQQEVPSQRELEREALRQVPREDPPVLRSQSMRNPHHSHRRRDNTPGPQPQARRHYDQVAAVAEGRRQYPQHGDDGRQDSDSNNDDVLSTIYGDYYLSESVTRSKSERRPSPRRMQDTPTMVGGYF